MADATLPSPPSSSASSTSSVAPLDLRPDTEWQDVEPDTEDIAIKSFFEEETFPNVSQFLENSKQAHGFDFAEIVRALDLDFYGGIRIVNYVRSEVKNGNRKPDVSSTEGFADDKYMMPVLEDDALLFCLDDILDLAKQGASQDVNESSTRQDAFTRVTELEEQLARMQLQFTDYRNTVASTLDERWTERESAKAPTGSIGLERQKTDKDNDSHYFDSYSYNDIHEIMLKDSVRTDSYRDFVYNHKQLFSGLTVLDVGCGTGILSMFSARAGASRVFAVDNSAIVMKATEIVRNNALEDRIKVLRGKIEELELPLDHKASDEGDSKSPVSHHRKVDVLMSEWMGYGLLYEAMLDSVLNARDRFLAPTGIMAPSHMTLRIAPLTDPDFVADSIGFWGDVYGFDMRPMTDKIYDDVIVRSVESKCLAGDSVEFKRLDLYSVKIKDLDFESPFEMVLDKDLDVLDGFVVWFDTFFLPQRSSVLPQGARAEKWKNDEGDGVAFTTGPGGKPTHWQSALLLIDRVHCEQKSLEKLALKAGQVIKGRIAYSKRKDNERQLDILVSWHAEGTSEKGAQEWALK